MIYIGIPISQLIDIKKGGNDKKAQGSWIHPDLAVQLAQWISTVFAIKVSKWIRELCITGKVIVGEEKKSEELLELQRELLNTKKEMKKLENKHTNLLEKRQYHKYKKGSGFYIITDMESNVIAVKPGIDKVDVNVRLQQHRSTKPDIKLEYLIYTKDCSLVEKAILARYKDYRKFQNHEWIYNVSVEELISSVKTFLSFSNIEYTEEKEL